jgi:hypothetical protein
MRRTHANFCIAELGRPERRRISRIKGTTVKEGTPDPPASATIHIGLTVTVEVVKLDHFIN